jgi:hypothetical protein
MQGMKQPKYSEKILDYYLTWLAHKNLTVIRKPSRFMLKSLRNVFIKLQGFVIIN